MSANNINTLNTNIQSTSTGSRRQPALPNNQTRINGHNVSNNAITRVGATIGAFCAGVFAKIHNVISKPQAQVAHDRINPELPERVKPVKPITFNDPFLAKIVNLSEQIEAAEARSQAARAEVRLGREQVSRLEWTLQKQPVKPTFEAFTKVLLEPGFDATKCEALCKRYGIERWTFPGSYEHRKQALLQIAQQLSSLTPEEQSKIIKYHETFVEFLHREEQWIPYRGTFPRAFCDAIDTWSFTYSTITHPVADFRTYLDECRKNKGENAVCNWLKGVMGERFTNEWLDAVTFLERAQEQMEHVAGHTRDLKGQLKDTQWEQERIRNGDATRPAIVGEWVQQGFLLPLEVKGEATGEEVRKAIELSFAQYVEKKFKMSDLETTDRALLKRSIRVCAATWANMSAHERTGFRKLKANLASDSTRATLFEALSDLDREIREGVTHVGSGAEALQKYKDFWAYQTLNPSAAKIDASLILGASDSAKTEEKNPKKY